MYIIGIDLSGPTNTTGTAFACFQRADACLLPSDLQQDVDDQDAYDYINQLDSPHRVVVGIDAPLSYNPGGGDRPAEKRLRCLVTDAGLSPGTIMPPTMTRMVYLTLRGMAIARTIQQAPAKSITIIETHPASVMAFHGAPVSDIQHLKHSFQARQNLIRWLDSQGVPAKTLGEDLDDHALCACAAAMGAWKWSSGESSWREPAAPPLHPFECAC